MADSTASLATSTPADLRATSYQASRRLVTSARLRDYFAPRDRDQVEALDALVITEPEGSSGTEQAKWH